MRFIEPMQAKLVAELPAGPQFEMRSSSMDIALWRFEQAIASSFYRVATTR